MSLLTLLFYVNQPRPKPFRNGGPMGVETRNRQGKDREGWENGLGSTIFSNFETSFDHTIMN